MQKIQVSIASSIKRKRRKWDEERNHVRVCIGMQNSYFPRFRISISFVLSCTCYWIITHIFTSTFVVTSRQLATDDLGLASPRDRNALPRQSHTIFKRCEKKWKNEKAFPRFPCFPRLESDPRVSKKEIIGLSLRRNPFFFSFLFFSSFVIPSRAISHFSFDSIRRMMAITRACDVWIRLKFLEIRQAKLKRDRRYNCRAIVKLKEKRKR